MGERDPGSFLGLLKRTNAHYAKAAGISSEEAKELTLLRSDIDEETYKFMLVPFLARVLTQLVLANDKVILVLFCVFLNVVLLCKIRAET
jgi:hypothetical protein